MGDNLKFKISDNSAFPRFFLGDECRVRDPRSGFEFNLSALKGKDYPVRSDKYIYHLSVCGGLQRGVCTDKDTGNDAVSSCQVDGSNHKIAGDQKKKKRSWFAVWLFLQLWLICACVCACECRDGEPASDLPGRSADLELHQRRDMSQDLPAVHRDPLLLPP